MPVAPRPRETINHGNKSLTNPGNDQGRKAKQLDVTQRIVDQGNARQQHMLAGSRGLCEEEHVAEHVSHEEPEQRTEDELLVLVPRLKGLTRRAVQDNHKQRDAK